MDILPRRNLPAPADPWGRKHDELSQKHDRRITNLELAYRGNNRATAGQLGIIGKQLETLQFQQAEITRTIVELEARKMLYLEAANLSVSGNATVAPFPTASRSFTFASPEGGRRRGLLSVSWNYTNSGGSGTPVSAYAEIVQDGTTIWHSRGGISVPYPTSAPGAWPVSEAVTLPVAVPSSGSVYALKIHRVGFTATTTTLTAQGISSTLTYGDRY